MRIVSSGDPDLVQAEYEKLSLGQAGQKVDGTPTYADENTNLKAQVLHVCDRLAQAREKIEELEEAREQLRIRPQMAAKVVEAQSMLDEVQARKVQRTYQPLFRHPLSIFRARSKWPKRKKTTVILDERVRISTSHQFCPRRAILKQLGKRKRMV